MKKAIFGAVSMLLLTTTLMLTFSIQPTMSSEPPATKWSRTYGGTQGDTASSVIQSSDGGYAIAGATWSFGAGDNDMWLIKTDANGVMQWNETYGGTSRDLAQAIVQTRDGGCAIAGCTWSFGAGGWDALLVIVDSLGKMQGGYKVYGGTSDDYAYSVVQTSDGYAIAGQTFSSGAGAGDCWLIKTDADGKIIWNKTYGGSGSDGAYSMIQTSDGGYLMAGHTGTALTEDFWLIKTYGNGDMEWNITLGGAGRDILRSVIQTSDGGYAAVGYTSPFPEPGPFDACLVKIDANGIVQWTKTYGEEGSEYAISMVQSSDGGFAVAGCAGSPDLGTTDFWVFKTDSTGIMQWNKTYGGSGRDEAYSVVQTSNGGYAIAGYTHSFGAGDFDCWLIRLAPEEIPAGINIDPDTLSLRSKGQWITVYIEPCGGYSADDIDISSILLNETLSAEPNPAAIGDFDKDGIPDLMVKFNRAEVISYILANINKEELVKEKSMTITLTITGSLNDGTPFEGSDTIRILYPIGGGSASRRS